MKARKSPSLELLRGVLTHKGIRPVKSGAPLWINNFPATLRSWARAPGEEELEVEDEMPWRLWTVSARWHVITQRKVSPVYCIVCTFSSTVSFTRPLACKMLSRLFHYQPPPSLHRQHYHAAWYSLADCKLGPQGLISWSFLDCTNVCSQQLPQPAKTMHCMNN